MEMSKTKRALLGMIAVSSVVAVACSDASRPLSTAPDRVEQIAPSENAKLLGGLLNPVLNLLLAPVKRTTPLANDVSWSFNAGPAGGFTSNSSLGVAVTIPPGALDENVTITVTAFQGAPIAYGFSPHLEFDRKVYITQSLKGTTCGLLNLACLSLKGGHFPGDRPTYTSDGLAIVDNVVSALLSTLTRTATFGVDHFSGWILASGAKN
jgi:hypothetical protein